MFFYKRRFEIAFRQIAPSRLRFLKKRVSSDSLNWILIRVSRIPPLLWRAFRSFGFSANKDHPEKMGSNFLLFLPKSLGPSETKELKENKIMDLFSNQEEKARVLEIVKKSTDIFTILRDFQTPEELAVLKSKLKHHCSSHNHQKKCGSSFFKNFQKTEISKLTETERALHCILSSDSKLAGLLPQLLDFLCSSLLNILRKSGQAREKLPREELRFLMTEVLKRGTTGFFQMRLRSQIREREREFSESQRLLAEPATSGCFFWNEYLHPDAFSLFMKRDFLVVEDVLDVPLVSAEVTFLEKLGKFDVESASKKHLDVLPEEVSASDFPNLARFAKELIKLPGFLNFQLSQMVFIISQFFRVHWFREEALVETLEHTCLGPFGSKRAVSVFLFIPYSTGSDAEIVVSINGQRMTLKAGNALICKPKKSEIVLEEATLKGSDKGFVLTLDVCGNSKVIDALGF